MDETIEIESKQKLIVLAKCYNKYYTWDILYLFLCYVRSRTFIFFISA